MRFTVEGWSPEYGLSADESGLEESADTVDVNVEVIGPEWQPIVPSGTVTPRCAVFVDGVRRIDARIWVEADGTSRPGVCASVAAGAVRCLPDAATIESARVFRGVFLSPTEGSGPIPVGPNDAYELVPTIGSRQEDFYLAIHDQMTRLETELAAGEGADVVVFDGPLRGRSEARGVGFIKTQHVQYLPDPQQAVVGRLGAGERSPLFLIAGRGFSRWSWYLRLPGEVTHPLAGIVRCELPALGTVEDAGARADAISAFLPRYASEAHKDSRAPQNLYPIAGLEQELRRRLGDQLLLERSLRRRAAASHAG